MQSYRKQQALWLSLFIFVFGGADENGGCINPKEERERRICHMAGVWSGQEKEDQCTEDMKDEAMQNLAGWGLADAAAGGAPGMAAIFGAPPNACRTCTGRGRIAVPVRWKCKMCNGTGGQPDNVCVGCGGDKQVLGHMKYKKCPGCAGTGRRPTEPTSE